MQSPTRAKRPALPTPTATPSRPQPARQFSTYALKPPAEIWSQILGHFRARPATVLSVALTCKNLHLKADIACRLRMKHDFGTKPKKVKANDSWVKTWGSRRFKMCSGCDKKLGASATVQTKGRKSRGARRVESWKDMPSREDVDSDVQEEEEDVDPALATMEVVETTEAIPAHNKLSDMPGALTQCESPFHTRMKTAIGALGGATDAKNTRNTTTARVDSAIGGDAVYDETLHIPAPSAKLPACRPKPLRSIATRFRDDRGMLANYRLQQQAAAKVTIAGKTRRSKDADAPRPPYLVKTHAMNFYGLKSEDLEGREFAVKKNPHYWRAAPMRLYFLEDIQRIAMERHGEALKKALKEL
ncbi:hypothetical protein HK101_010094 [Irineochytrium annulatum]|nr:hypothetical protein HK101_010094 [Irineochytrium annulatum]